MNSWALRLYHGLPGPARSVVASARGHALRRWRYGAETDVLADAALARDTWSANEWAQWRDERLARVLHRAATRVPYYRAQWAARRRRGDRAGWEYLESWPVLEKEPVRAHAEAFLADDCDPRRMFREQTSGTSGQPLRLWWSRGTVRAWYALFEARCRRWYGVTRHDRWAMLGGQLVTPVTQQAPPFWVWNSALRQLYLSSYHLSPTLVPHYLDAIEARGVRYLWGYTSSLVPVAEEALRTGRQLPGLAVAITNAEPLDAAQRATLTAGFGCPVRETYGMAEIVAAGSECAHGRLHLWPDVGVVEVHDDDGADAGPDVIGRLVCTGLLNEDMPLVRYAVGDRGARAAATDAPCGCGRRMPWLTAVEGRTDDVLYTRDGRRVGRLDPVFKERLPVRATQIVQEAIDRIHVRYVPADGFAPSDAASIARRLRDRLGDVVVTLEPVDAIPRTANGKVRGVVCGIPAHARPTGRIA